MKRERGSSIGRVLDILDTVAASTKPLSATEINETLNLPKATAHRLCAQLEARGYLLKRIDGKSYQAGNSLVDVAVGVLANSRFGATRHAILTELSERVNISMKNLSSRRPELVRLRLAIGPFPQSPMPSLRFAI